jgi:cbb3-type cytochrome oxidase subunit 3
MKKMALFFLLKAVLFVSYSMAADLVKVKDIMKEPYQFRNETVGVIGIVSQLQTEKTGYPAYYFLRDSWGSTIKVITENDLPEIDNLYELKGFVILKDIKENEKEICIVEMTRKKITNLNSKENPISESDLSEAASEKKKQSIFSEPKKNENRWPFYLSIANAILLVIIISTFYFFWRSKRGKFDNNSTNDLMPLNDDTKPGGYHESPFSTNIDTGPLFPEPSEYIEDSSIRTAAPPEGTLKLLPGRLEIISGYDKQKDIRFYKLPQQEETETTFGRSAGPHYSHIQFKSLTVSPKQAKFLWANGKYQIINYSTTNPTIVNDKALAKDQLMTLEAGNKIEMGEVVFIFHDK